jgi:outer membrane protein OmpA-like peptidoglycan-associated protein
MKTRHFLVLVRLVTVLGLSLMLISGCRVMFSHLSAMRRLPLPAVGPSVLVIVTDPDSSPAMVATEALALGSARPGERLLILSSRGGAVLAAAQAPPAPSMQVALPPTALPAHATSFQQEELAAWAKSVLATADAKAIPQREGSGSIGADLGFAASDIFSLRQADLGYGTGTVIVIIGIGNTAMGSAPALPAGLRGSSVVVDDFPDNITEQAAWQSSLDQGGAARVVLLTPVTEGQLVPVVKQGLDGAITDTLTSVLFALGQYKLQAAALPQMRRLLYLLTVRYPSATVTINGYTDNLPAPGGNLRLSELRAQEVADWLIAHGVAAARLQAFGYGDTDAVAPNASHGQLLNRRVVAVIDPATAAGAG